MNVLFAQYLRLAGSLLETIKNLPDRRCCVGHVCILDADLSLRAAHTLLAYAITLDRIVPFAVPTTVVVTMIGIGWKVLPAVIRKIHLFEAALLVWFHRSVATALHAKCAVLVVGHIWPGISCMTDAHVVAVALAYLICPTRLYWRLVAPIVPIIPACDFAHGRITRTRLAPVRAWSLLDRLA